MKKSVLFVLVSLVFVSVLSFAIAAEQDIPTQVTVSEFLSVTITPCSDPLTFGNGAPGDDDLAITCQDSSNPAVVVANDPISNVNMIAFTKGTDFTDGSVTFTPDSIRFSNMSNSLIPGADLDYSWKGINTELYGGSVAPGSSIGVWYWLSVDAGQEAGTYTGTISVTGVKTGTTP